jgi:hypothetical protein
MHAPKQASVVKYEKCQARRVLFVNGNDHDRILDTQTVYDFIRFYRYRQTRCVGAALCDIT